MRRALLVLGIAVLAASCSERPRTQVMLIVDADATVRASATSVVIEIAGRAQGEVFGVAGTETFDPRETGWPIEVAIVPRGDDPSREWRAVVGAGEGGDRVEARAIGGFVREQTLSYTLRLSSRCAGVTCNAEETCFEAGCVGAFVPTGSLDPYVPPGRTDAGTLDAGSDEDAGGADGGTDAGTDAGTDCLPATPRVDLLLVVDNSGSMAEEQLSLAVELPFLVDTLTTGDVNGDSLPDFAPIEDLQIGVVTSDLGAAGAPLPMCNRARYGDDGVLRTAGNTSITGCAAMYPEVFGFASGDDPDTYAFEVACVARVGTAGCGIEQPLEAMLKAIAPATSMSWTAPGYEPITFFEGTSGHGSGANAGLFRADSVLAVVVLTDEEDCSWIDPELVNPGSTTYTEDLNLRCFHHPDVLHPVARYAQGLLQMRRDPRRLVFAAIAGIPLDADPGDAPASYASILANPAMEERIDPDATIPRLVPSCDVPGRGVALPPRRIVQVAQRLGATPGVGHTVHSICQESFRVPFTRIARLIGARVDGTCEP